jgi:serine protease Do
VIRKIDGVAVVDSTDVTSRIGNSAPGTSLNVEVWRAGKAMELTAKVGTLDDEKVAKVSDESAPKGKLGIAVRPRTAEEQKAGEKSGLVVQQSGGAAARAGVQAGDVILGVGSSPINTVDELRTAVDKAGKTVALLIDARGRQIYVPVKLS